MKTQIAYSQSKEIDQIIQDLKQQLDTFSPNFIQFYASPSINPSEISQAIYEAFGKVNTIGCSSSGEIISGQMLDNSIVLMAFDERIVEDCALEVVENLSDSSNIDNAFTNFKAHYNLPITDMDSSKYVGLVLIDGLTGLEEEINERIGDKTNISFIGGSAGDDLKFEQTFLYVNGKYYKDAAVLVLIKSATEFDILKTQSFVATSTQLTVTKTDLENRTVLEFNNKPALEAYAEALNVAKEEVVNYFPTNPVGLVYDNDIFVRSPKQVQDNNITFYCRIQEGMVVNILESKDIVEQTKNDLKEKQGTLGEISAIVNFNCILRTLELKDKKQTDAYGALFGDIPTVGFSTYGESYIGHINQTATMLLFK